MFISTSIRTAGRRFATGSLSNTRRSLASNAARQSSSNHQESARKIAPYFAAAGVALSATQLSLNQQVRA